MKETSILYKIAMVQAILNNIKKMTRRVVMGKLALEWLEPDMFTPEFVATLENGLSPYGYAGDLLWVKEEHYAYGTWFTEGFTKTGQRKWRFHDRTDNDHPVCFFDNKPERVNRYQSGMLGYHKRNSLFLPKKFARIWLKVISVRVERLQEITEEDAMKEGIEERPGGFQILNPEGGYFRTVCPRQTFQSLWDSINGHPRKDGKDISWDANPWVWVVEFERVDRPRAAKEKN